MLWHIVVVVVVAVAVAVGAGIRFLDFELEQGLECEGSDLDDVRKPVHSESN